MVGIPPMYGDEWGIVYDIAIHQGADTKPKKQRRVKGSKAGQRVILWFIPVEIAQKYEFVNWVDYSQYMENILQMVFSIDWFFPGKSAGQSHDLHGKIWLVSG